MSGTERKTKPIRNSDDAYRKAIEELRDYAIFMTDPNGLVTNWNVGAEQILGYTESEIIGKNASRFFTVEDRSKDIPSKELESALTHGRAEDERWHIRRDGSRFWATGVVTPVRDESGNLIGFSKVMRDMTERNRLTEERDRFFTLSMDLLCIVHLDGRFQRVNPAFENVLGFSADELSSMRLFDLVHPDDLDGTMSAYEGLKAGEPTRFMENRLRCKDGNYKWVGWSYFPVPEDDVAFGVGRDMTQIRRINEILKQRADELEHANRVKDEFLATLSHELRTPLTSILGWSRLLRLAELNPSERERAIGIIERNAESQSKLIEDLLDVSRIITGKLKIEFQPVPFATIVENVVHSLVPTATAKSIKLETFIDRTAGPIHGDPARLQQIVANVLSNAIKFTNEGGHITVRVERIDAHVRLEVEDTGVGIAAEDLPHIFERFRQADSSNVRAHSGLGLGLAIVDYLVRQHNGTVEAKSGGRGRGATFIIEMPLTSSEVVTRGERNVDLFSEQGGALLDKVDGFDYPQLQDVRILVVEDDQDTRELLTMVLNRCGAKVTAVGSAKEGLDLIRKEVPDLLVSDIGMTGENGYELIKKIRSLPADEGGHVPAIALTAYAGAADRRRALLSGFQTHLSKPVEPDELLAVVSSLSAQQE